MEQEEKMYLIILICISILAGLMTFRWWWLLQ